MSVKRVVVSADLDTGAIAVDLTGFKGKGCADVARCFEGLGDVKKSVKKPEYKQETVNLIRK